MWGHYYGRVLKEKVVRKGSVLEFGIIATSDISNSGSAWYVALLVPMHFSSTL